MKNPFKRFFGKSREKSTGDILSIAKALDPVIETAAGEVFRVFAPSLIHRPVTYIVPAVWGASDEAPLEPLQVRINQVISPAVERAVSLFRWKAATDAQAFALGYLVRSLFISKLSFMLTSLKHETGKTLGDPPDGFGTLDEIDPIGRA